jgi:hypothetical protein
MSVCCGPSQQARRTPHSLAIKDVCGSEVDPVPYFEVPSKFKKLVNDELYTMQLSVILDLFVYIFNLKFARSIKFPVG